MTCIVGMEHNGRVVFGADSQVTNGGIGYTSGPSKVFVINGIVMGYTGPCKVGNILRHRLQPTKPPKRNLDNYISTTLVDLIRSAFNTHGFLEKNNGWESTLGNIMIGLHGSIYVMEENFQVLRFQSKYHAIGSGQEIALGSLFSTSHIKTPKKRIEMALKAAANYCTTVGGPFKFCYED